MKKSIVPFLLLWMSFVEWAWAQSDQPLEYTVMEALPGITNTAPIDDCTYFGSLVAILIGVAAGLAVIIFVLSGIRYIWSAVSVSQRQEAKERMMGAGIGVLIAITSWLLLYSIDQSLVIGCSAGTNVPQANLSAFAPLGPLGTPPVITFLPAVVSLEMGDPIDLFVGVSATDAEDGPFPISSVTVLGGVFTSDTPGSHIVSYQVQDTAGNITTEQRVFVISPPPSAPAGPGPAPVPGPAPAPVPDTVPPTIYLSGATPLTIEVGSVYTEPGFYAWDNYDHDVTALVTSDAAAVIDTTTSGTFTVTYSVTDSDGNTGTETRIVNVVYDIDTTTDVSYRRSCFGLLPLGPCAAADFDGSGFITGIDELAAYGYIKTLQQNGDYIIDMKNGSSIYSCLVKVNSSSAAFPAQNCSVTTFSFFSTPEPCVVAKQDYPTKCALTSYSGVSFSSSNKTYYSNVMNYADRFNVGRYKLTRVYSRLMCSYFKSEDIDTGEVTHTWDCENSDISTRDRIFYSTLQQLDLNNDGYVDTRGGSADRAIFESCLNNPLLAGCSAADLNRDGVINYGDLALNELIEISGYVPGTTIGEIERTTFLPEQYTDRRIVTHCAAYGYKVRSCANADVNRNGAVNGADVAYFDARAGDPRINLNGDTQVDGYSSGNPPPPASSISWSSVSGNGSLGQSCAAWQGVPAAELQLVILESSGTVFSVTNNCEYENVATGVFFPAPPTYTDPNSRPVGLHNDPFTGMAYQTQKQN